MQRDKVQEVFDLLTDVYGESPWTFEQIETDLAQGNTDYFFDYQNGQLVGFLAIQNLVGELEITNIAVRKSHQGRGVAKRLMTNLEQRLETIFLEVRASNAVAQALYESHGFEVVGRRKDYYRQPVEDAILMQRVGYER